MTLPGYNHKFGQKITTDAVGVDIDRAFLAHYHIDASDAVIADADGVFKINLGTEAQTVDDGIVSPAVPRNLTVVGNVSGITGTVKITGTDFAGEAIEESFTLNGDTADTGDLAFKTITKVELPVQTHTPAQQTETIQVTAGVSGTPGDITVAVTASALGDDSPASVAVTLTADDNTAAEVAAKIVDALNEDNTISAAFTASVTGAGNDTVTLTANAPAANDTTLEIAVTAGSTGVTVGSSANGTPGVPYDIVSIGWGDKFGLPYKLYADELVILKLFNKAKETTEGTITADADDLAKNVYDPHDTTLGVDIDLYIIV